MEYSLNHLLEKLFKRNSVPGWTADKIAALRELWLAGKTASEIGRELHASRNAVCGKAWRLKLPHPSMVGKVPRVRTEAQRVAQRKRATKNELPQWGHDITPTAADNPVTIHQLENHHCRWPCEGSGVDMIYCGGKRYGKEAYCARHVLISVSR